MLKDCVILGKCFKTLNGTPTNQVIRLSFSLNLWVIYGHIHHQVVSLQILSYQVISEHDSCSTVNNISQYFPYVYIIFGVYPASLPSSALKQYHK